MSNSLEFFVNGKRVRLESPDPEWTLLYFLRYKMGLCGTKEGCGEGGCGACTVLLSKWDSKIRKVLNYAVVACLTPLYTLHGVAVVTVEGIGSVRRGLHPVQERIAKSHGTQCGFCTPGFVMSTYALLRNNPNPSQNELEDALQGNLCRCTGYRPILSGLKTFCCKGFDAKNGCCQDAKNCVPNNNESNIELATALYDTTDFKPYDPSQDVIFPAELMLDSRFEEEDLCFKNSSVQVYMPVSWAKLLLLKDLYPEAKIVGGNTELGIGTKLNAELPQVYIYPSSNIKELQEIETKKCSVLVGGGASLTNLSEQCHNLVANDSRKIGTVVSSLKHLIHAFGGLQVRNVATIAGNIVTASPISDLNPLFVASECRVVLESLNGSKMTTMDENFFVSYRKTSIQPNEVLKSVYIPSTKENEFIWGEKQCRRRDDDIAIVNTGMKVSFEEHDSTIIQNAVIAYGGMAPTTSIAKKTAKYLIGKRWSNEFLERVGEYLKEDFSLQLDVPGGMPEYRMSLALSFFYKFYLSVSKWLVKSGRVALTVDRVITTNGLTNHYAGNQDLDLFKTETEPSLNGFKNEQAINAQLRGITLDNRWLSAIQPCSRLDTQESQLYQIVPRDQPATDLVGRPLSHLSALKHATGEAIYVDDIPTLKNEHFGKLIINRVVAHGKITLIDASEALKIPGVLGFFDAKDIRRDGSNNFGVVVEDEEVFASEEVKWVGQSLGIIVAKDQFTAERAATLVRVEIEPSEPIILTIDEAIEAKSFMDVRKLKKGDFEGALKDCEHVLEYSLRVGGQEQFYLETQCCLAVPKEDDELEIFLSTQGPVAMQRTIASCLKLKQNRVTVKTRRIGGSFGGKESRCALVGIPAAYAAHRLGVPVRMTLNRLEDMEITGHRNPYLFQYKVGFNSDGVIQGIKIRFYINSGGAQEFSSMILNFTTFALDSAFRIENWDVCGRSCRTNLPPNTAMRGFGTPEASIFIHTVFESVAAFLGTDSLELRKQHFYKNGDLSHANQLLQNVTLERCLDECLYNSDFENRKNLVEEFNSKNTWKKRGIAVTTTKHNLGFDINLLNQAGALVMVHLDGSVSLNHGGMEMGQGLHTKMIQIATRVLEIPESKIYFSETATDKVPNATSTCGSVSSDLNGMAVKVACETLKSRIEPFKNSNPEGNWEDWIVAAYLDRTNLSAVGFYKEPEVSFDFDKNEGSHYLYNSYGAAVSEVEIDCLTGDHTVLSTWIVMDVGESLNPAVDIGQIEGAFVQGYGLFVLEELLHTPQGALITKGPSNYKIPTTNDIPSQFHVALLRGSPNSRAIYSSRGIGEPPLTLSTSIFFAIRNAIAAARMEHKLPLDFILHSPATAEKIRLACQNKYSVQITQTKSKSKVLPWSIKV